MAAGSGETQAQAGKRGIDFWGDSSWELSVGDGGGTPVRGWQWGSYPRVFVWGCGVGMSRTIGHTHSTRPLVPILSCFVVLLYGCEHVKCKMSVRKLGRGEERKWKRKRKDCEKMRDDSLGFIVLTPCTHSLGSLPRSKGRYNWGLIPHHQPT